MKINEAALVKFAILGVSPSKSSIHASPFSMKLLISLAIATSTPSSFLVYLLYEAGTLKEFTESITISFGVIAVAFSFGTIAFQMNEFFETLDAMQTIIDKRLVDPDSKAIFEKTRQQTEKINKIIFYVGMKVPLAIIWPICINSFIVYLKSDFKNESFVLPLPMWFPFDTKNPIGYLMGSILEYIACYWGFFAGASMLSFAIGIYLLIISTTKDLKCILYSVNKCARKEGKRLEMLRQMSEFIEMHSAMKQQIYCFSHIVQPIFLTTFAWGLGAISAGLLMISLKTIRSEMDIMVLFITMFEAWSGFLTVFIGCDLGQRTSDAFEGITFKIDMFHWYLFPDDLKRILPTVIAISQQTFELRVVGSFSLSREVFKKIVHKAYSIFMFIRRLIE